VTGELPEPRCPKIHSSFGYVCWPARHERGKPHASVYCCGDAACVEECANWVESVTGHAGEYHPFIRNQS